MSARKATDINVMGSHGSDYADLLRSINVETVKLYEKGYELHTSTHAFDTTRGVHYITNTFIKYEPESAAK